MRFINLLLDLCQEWEEIITLGSENPKEWVVYHKCTKWTRDKHCRRKGMVSVNQKDKIYFINDGLSKESLNDIIQALETHPNRNVPLVLLDLVKLFNKEKKHYSLRNLTLKYPVC